MWTYRQSTGELFHEGRFVARGYSGRGAGLNRPDMQAAKATGPIPRGRWTIGAPYSSRNTGPFTMPLIAQDGDRDDTHRPTGRGAFRIHGDNSAMNHTASHGCIILARSVRAQIWESADRELEVVA